MLAMPDASLETTRRIESVCDVPLGADMLPPIVPGMVVGVFIDCSSIADGVEVTGWVISATRELFSEDEVMEF